MHLSQIEVVNFRSLQHVTVSLQPGLNVLVGRNNTGKSNLLTAIRHAVGPYGSKPETLWLTEDDFYRPNRKSAPAQQLSVTLTYEGLSEEQRAHFFEMVDFDLANVALSRAVLRLEACRQPNGSRISVKRVAALDSAAENPTVASELLDALPITFLPALRDAEVALSPGQRSRLAALLKDLADKKGSTAKPDIEGIFGQANESLEKQTLISEVRNALQTSTKSMAGTDYLPTSIRATDVDFERILRTLRVVPDEGAAADLGLNGLGYNNLLYIAVVLEHLSKYEAHECPLLLVEEPEAHLHPQLTLLLADYLAHSIPGSSVPQTLVTTHSPSLASHIPPSRVTCMFWDSGTNGVRCNAIADVGLDATEETQLQRMMDVTRACLYFAKGVILVEGISEALLVPVLALRLGHNLARHHVSVVPICGVAFDTFRKLFGPDGLAIPMAIVTDADPAIKRGSTYDQDVPEGVVGAWPASPRTKDLIVQFASHPNVAVFSSKLTLEYDLAEAGPDNPTMMAEVWESCFKGTPKTLNSGSLAAVGNDLTARALHVWRGICRAQHSLGKGEFAHQLAMRLAGSGSSDTPDNFAVPSYLEQAILHVVGKLQAV